MSSSIDRFNLVAGYYDRLVKLVFGKSMREAQVYFLRDVSPGSNVLILGGGTGWILKALLDRQPDCRVWYIEASSEMIKLAKQKNKADQRQVTFIHGTEDSIPEVRFDFVVVNFFLDLFPSAPMRKVIGKIRTSLNSGGLLLATDFISAGKYWQRLLLKVMYFFFRIMCGIESKTLPAWQAELRASGLDEIRSQLFYHGFIKTALFENREVSG